MAGKYRDYDQNGNRYETMGRPQSREQEQMEAPNDEDVLADTMQKGFSDLEDVIEENFSGLRLRFSPIFFGSCVFILGLAILATLGISLAVLIKGKRAVDQIDSLFDTLDDFAAGMALVINQTATPACVRSIDARGAVVDSEVIAPTNHDKT
jgi:hypothetical protein